MARLRVSDALPAEIEPAGDPTPHALASPVLEPDIARLVDYDYPIAVAEP